MMIIISDRTLAEHVAERFTTSRIRRLHLNQLGTEWHASAMVGEWEGELREVRASGRDPVRVLQRLLALAAEPAPPRAKTAKPPRPRAPAKKPTQVPTPAKQRTLGAPHSDAHVRRVALQRAERLGSVSVPSLLAVLNGPAAGYVSQSALQRRDQYELVLEQLVADGELEHGPDGYTLRGRRDQTHEEQHGEAE